MARTAADFWTDDGWLRSGPGVPVTRMPGRQAGYRSGRVILRAGVIHFTVGRDSRGPGVSGLFQHLLAKWGEIFTFCPGLAVCAHACEINPFSIGVETEKLGDGSWWEETTGPQLRALAWLAAAYATLGLPADTYHNGYRDVNPRGPYPAHYLSHRTLDIRACDPHVDQLPDEELALVFEMANEFLGAGTSVNRTREAWWWLCQD